jgi:hypothetical protein
MLYFYGFVSQQVTPEKLLWELSWIIFLRFDVIIGDILFYGFADHILHSATETTSFWGHS